MTDHIIEIAAWIYVLKSAHYIVFEMPRSRAKPVIQFASLVMMLVLVLFGGITLYHKMPWTVYFLGTVFGTILAGGLIMYAGEALLTKWRNRNARNDVI